MATPDDPTARAGRKPRPVPPQTMASVREVHDDDEPELEPRVEKDDDVDEGKVGEAELEQEAAVEKVADSDAEVAPEKKTRRERKAEILKVATKPDPAGPPPMVVVARREDQELADWLGQLGGSGGLKIGVMRTEPRTFAGKNTKGHLETVEGFVTEDQLLAQWGGGTYQLRVLQKDRRGSYIYKASTTISIAGDPRIDNLPKADPNAEVAGARATAESSAGTDRILGVLERQIDRGNKAPTGPDFQAISAFMRPLELQIKTLSDALAKKDEQMQALANKPANPFQDQLLGKLIDDDNVRVQQIRTAHEAEIRTLKENATATEERLRDRFEREKDTLERRHERELGDQKTAFEREISTLKSSFERELGTMKAAQEQIALANATSTTVQKAALETDNRRLERDLAKTETEVVALRAKKDLSPIEMFKQVETIKETLGLDGEDREKGTLEKIADTVMGSDKLFEFMGKWVGPKNGAPQQQQMHPTQAGMQHKPRIIRQNGQVYALQQDGKYYPVRRRRNQEGAETEEFEEGLQIPPEQVAFATSVLEQSFTNDKKPEAVAATISTALSPEIFQAIRDHGVDGFLNKVAKLSSTSPLRRQDGRNWLRKLGKALLGEAPDEPGTSDSDGTEDVDLDDELGLE